MQRVLLPLYNVQINQVRGGGGGAGYWKEKS